tara:strand:+ start:217 stop:477 length:261 start_codon:yes stop_codon:yes gene_type:complete
MDNKNVFIAIALSMSVLLFWAAFFENPKPVNNNTPQQQKANENIITPNINESLKINKGDPKPRRDTQITAKPKKMNKFKIRLFPTK